MSAPAPSTAHEGSSRGWPDLRPLLFPGSAALIGLSERSASEVVHNAAGRGVTVTGVHPRLASVMGIRCVPTAADLPETPDVAFMLVGHRNVEAAFEDALAAGIRAFVMPGLGNEAGPEGPAIARRIAERAQRARALVVGPNCMGVAVPDAASFWIGTITPSFIGGHVSAVVQSGSIGEALLAVGPRVGFRTVVSSGGEFVTDVADYCAFFAEDEGTRAVGLFLEQVRRPDAFARALTLLAEAGKPVACLRVGRSSGGARAVLAHSGAVVGSQLAFSAFLRAYGVIEVGDYPELIEVLEVLGRKRRPSGARLGGVTNSGGEGALLADHAEAAGLPFGPLSDQLVRRLIGAFPNYVAPQNPVDAWAIDEVDRVFPGTLQLLAESGEFDILVAQVDESLHLGGPEIENALLITRALADAVEGTTIFPAVTSVQSSDAPAPVVDLARERDIALLRGSQNAMKALAAVAGWAPRRPPERRLRPAAKLEGLYQHGSFPEYESGAILERYGIPIARRRRAASPQDAARAAEEVGFPAVVKRDGPAHKSREGGVILDLPDADSVRRAAERLGGQVLIAQQAKPGVEVFCGMSRDPEFGPVLVVGLGGPAAETAGGKSACVAPISLDQARQLIAGARAVSTLIPSGAATSLAGVMVALGELALDHPEISAVDVNPVVVGERDVVAVDALIVVGEGKS